jgi:hypothetical protein
MLACGLSLRGVVIIAIYGLRALRGEIGGPSQEDPMPELA